MTWLDVVLIALLAGSLYSGYRRGAVLQVIGLVRMHRTSTGKAVGAVLLPLVLCCVCVAVVFALFLGAIMSAISEMN